MIFLCIKHKLTFYTIHGIIEFVGFKSDEFFTLISGEDNIWEKYVKIKWELWM